MIIEGKVTREWLRSLNPGQTVTFTGLKANEIDTGKTIATQTGRVLECRFVCSSDYVNGTLTITREAL